MTAGRRALGAHGEALAARWYERHGYEVLARNWRCREGEIDLVVRRGTVIAVCEVKARSTAAFGSPAEAVTRTKQQRIRRVAMRWLEETGTRGRVRFDVACVLGGRLDEVIEGAF